ncbi:MAG: nucleotidyltransferase family protein, partial [Acidobacteria bacterium]|nr:nucleotidyltransferase family protein [Acidobacteriota bacterium]
MARRLDSAALTAELRILLAAARATPAEGPIEPGPFDADELFRLAGAHRMVQLLHELSAAGNPDLPDSLRHRLAAETQAIALHNLRLTAELLNLLPEFARREIQ